MGSGLRFCDSQSAKLLVTAYGHVGREFKLRPFSAGSILTLRNRTEPLRFRIDVGAPANINASIGRLAERDTASLKTAPATAGYEAGEHHVTDTCHLCV